MLVYYIKLKSRLAVRPSVCLSVRLHFWHAHNSVVGALIKMGLTRNESCVFEEHKVYFYKPTEPTVHRQECVKDEGVRGQTRKACGRWFGPAKQDFLF